MSAIPSYDAAKPWNWGAVIAVWLICAAVVVIKAGFLVALTWHPAHEIDPTLRIMIETIPYAAVAFVNLLLGWHRGALGVLIGDALIVGSLDTFMGYCQFVSDWKFLDERQAGRHVMNCGPPGFLFVWVFLYVFTFTYTILACLLAPFRRLA